MKVQFSKKIRIMKKLEKILKSVNIKVNSVRFKKSFKNVNISESDHEIILFIMHNFLHNDMKLLAAQVNAVLDNQLLHSLIHDIISVDLTELIYIINVSEFKVDLAVSADSSSVVNLSEFENLQSKF